MKSITFLSIFICLIFIIGMTSCEKADIQKSLPNDKVKIETREVDDCDECPDDDCCCSVALTGTTSSAVLYLCGTHDGVFSGGCGPIYQGSCETISGEDQTITLSTPSDVSGKFCIQKNHSFMIGSLTGGTVTFTLTCQYGQTSPQVVNVSLAAPNKLFYTVDDDCILTDCQ